MVKRINDLPFYEWKEYQKMVTLDSLFFVVVLLVLSIYLYDTNWIVQSCFGLALVFAYFISAYKLQRRFLCEVD